MGRVQDITLKITLDTSAFEKVRHSMHSTPPLADPFKVGVRPSFFLEPKEESSQQALTLHLTTPLHFPEFVALLEGGAFVLSGKHNGKYHLSLHETTYHQFHSNGLIFSTGGAAFDPSFEGLRLVEAHHWLLRPYTTVQFDETAVDKQVAFRDKHWVLFPVGTTETTEGDTTIYAHEDNEQHELLIRHGHLSMRPKKRVWKKGDKAIVTIQGQILRGVYNCDEPVREMMYIDFGDQNDDDGEYMLINASCVFHAE